MVEQRRDVVGVRGRGRLGVGVVGAGRVGAVLGAALLGAGTGHLTTMRQEFQAQVPTWVPLDPDLVVLASGVVELAVGAVALLGTEYLVAQHIGRAQVLVGDEFVAEGLTHTAQAGQDVFDLTDLVIDLLDETVDDFFNGDRLYGAAASAAPCRSGWSTRSSSRPTPVVVSPRPWTPPV